MRLRSVLFSLGMLIAVAGGCRNDTSSGPPIPASSDPQGADLVEGAVVIATEKGGGVRIYKIKEVKYFPPPMGDELVMIAFDEKGKDFAEAADMWTRRKLTVVIDNVRVQRQMFNKRDYRVIQHESVSDSDKKLKPGQPLPPRAATSAAP